MRAAIAICLEYKGYGGGAERDANGYRQGFVENLLDSTVIYDGDNLAELAANFVAVVDEYLADCGYKNAPRFPTGHLVIRIMSIPFV